MIDPSILEPLRSRQTQIAKRRADLAVRLGKLRREDEALQAEHEELETTLRTLARVYGVELSQDLEGRAGKSTGGGSTKPDDAPTLYEMVTTLMNEWDFLDDLHEGQEIYDAIRKRWWPDAPRNSIIPSLWRFANEGRLVKEGTRYGLPPKNEAPGVGAPSASKLEEDLDDEIPF